jgi:hypothetical protein
MLVTLYLLSLFALGSEAEPQLQNAASSWPPTISTASRQSLAPVAVPAPSRASTPAPWGPPRFAPSPVSENFSSAATGIPKGSCKWIPGQEGWPSDADWTELNRQVQGRLTKPTPPAAPCHRELGGAGGGNCQSVSDGFGDSAWHARNPISNMWQNYNNYSCMPSGGVCTTDGYPVYVVAARSAGDVKAAVDFARSKNIRLNIKSTGHDFLGRYVEHTFNHCRLTTPGPSSRTRSRSGRATSTASAGSPPAFGRRAAPSPSPAPPSRPAPATSGSK